VTAGIDVCVCGRCGHAVYPYRALCPECGAREWRVERVERGVVEQATTIRHRVGVARRVPVGVASVHVERGPVVIARLLGAATAGAVVALGTRAGGVVARPVGSIDSSATP
jgi:uncharacterized OB-fold protein